MAMRIDEFDVPAELSVQEVNRRVAQWLNAGQPGTDYLLLETSDTHVTLKKEKRDLKICIFSCCGSLGIVFVLILFMVGTLYYADVEAIISFAYAVTAVGLIGVAAGFACYILNTTKVAYVVKFGEGTPLHIVVYCEGQTESGREDYHSLKSAIVRGPPPPPSPW